MNLSNEVILQSIDTILNTLKPNKQPQTIQRIRSILLTNHERGRIEKFSNGNLESLNKYLQTFLSNYETQSPYIQKIQVEKDEMLWKELFEKLSRWAYTILVRYNFKTGNQTSILAQELATDAAIILLKAHFPYDTEFDSWAHVIVYNVCLKFFRKGSTPTNPDNTAPLDELIFQIAKPDKLSETQKSNLRLDLLNAIEQLSPNRQHVILAIYFYGLSVEEIAQQMSKTPQAIYNLKHNALNDLRKILGTNWNTI